MQILEVCLVVLLLVAILGVLVWTTSTIKTEAESMCTEENNQQSGRHH